VIARPDPKTYNARILKAQLLQHFSSLPKKWRELYLEKALPYKYADNAYYDKLWKQNNLLEENMPF
jgi:hypothetical protein